MKIEIKKRYKKIFVGAPGSKNVLRTVNFQFYNRKIFIFPRKSNSIKKTSTKTFFENESKGA